MSGHDNGREAREHAPNTNGPKHLLWRIGIWRCHLKRSGRVIQNDEAVGTGKRHDRVITVGAPLGIKHSYANWLSHARSDSRTVIPERVPVIAEHLEQRVAPSWSRLFVDGNRTSLYLMHGRVARGLPRAGRGNQERHQGCSHCALHWA